MIKQFLKSASAGILAAILIAGGGMAVQAEEPPADPAEEKLLVDTDSGADFYNETEGNWSGSSVAGYDGSGTRYSLSQYAAAEWYPVVADEETYEVRIYHPVHTTDVTNDVKITLYDAEKQELYSEEYLWTGEEEAGWTSLGEYELQPGKYTVRLEKLGQQENPNSPGTHDQALRADAVELVKESAQQPEQLPEVSSEQEAVIDYGDMGYRETGTWMESGLTGYNGSKTRYTSEKDAAAQWQAKVVSEGSYEVWLYQIGNANNSKSVSVNVTGGTPETDVTEDWSSVASGWKLLGEYNFEKDAVCSVQIKNLSSDVNKYMRADAVKIAYKQPEPEITELPKADYYVDVSGGSDENDGLSPDTAWASLDKVNSCSFAPGSRILLKKGETWSGRLAPKGSGTESEPIILGSYGDGENRPVINGNGCEGGTIELHNQEFWEITGLEVTNHKDGEAFGNITGNTQTRHGILIKLENFDKEGDNTAEHIYVNDCYVHDVIGNLGNPHNGVGIFYFVSDPADKSRFHDVRIEGNDVRNVDRSGIIIRSQDVTDPDTTYNTDVVIEKNYVENIAGDGIVAKVSTGAVIQYNEVNYACARATGGNVNNAAVWVWQCKDSVIQYNEVYNTGLEGGNKDGQAFDSDFNCEGCVIQYNYSHDNKGGFVLLIAPSGNDFNRDTVVRYNVSENDKKDVIEVSGAVENAKIYNNTIYQSEDCPTNLLRVNTYFGIPESALLQNNIFCSEAENTITMTENDNGRPFRGSITVDHNLFYGFPVPESEDKDVDETVGGINYKGHWTLTVTDSIEADPLLVDPGRGITGIDFTDTGRLAGYQIQDNSPAVDAGAVIEDNGDQDFRGESIDNKPDIGAYEYTGSTESEESEQPGENPAEKPDNTGDAEASDGQQSAVQTGDDTSLFLPAAAAVVSLALAATIVVVRKRKC